MRQAPEISLNSSVVSDILHSFLVRNGLFRAFMKNLKSHPLHRYIIASPNNQFDFIDRFCAMYYEEFSIDESFSYRNLISSAFVWNTTKEGDAFWRLASQNWSKYLKSKYCL